MISLENGVSGGIITGPVIDMMIRNVAAIANVVLCKLCIECVFPKYA